MRYEYAYDFAWAHSAYIKARVGTRYTAIMSISSPKSNEILAVRAIPGHHREAQVESKDQVEC